MNHHTNAPHPALTPATEVVRINAGAACDALNCNNSPVSVLVRTSPGRSELLAIGAPESVESSGLPTPDRVLDRPRHLLLPPMVNAHTHLDLTHIGPVEHDPARGFVPWINHILENRRTGDAAIVDAVLLGVDASVRGGTVAVGDIGGVDSAHLTASPARALAASGLAGVSFLEFFGIGASAAPSAERLSAFCRDELSPLRAEIEGMPARVGLQPHAPNTVDLGVYQWCNALAREHQLPLATHLAETVEERAFIGEAVGPQRELLERLGLWTDDILDRVGNGAHPVDHVQPVLKDAWTPYLCAHLNDAPDAAIRALASTDTCVAYCPRGSSYFGAHAHFGPHRYQDMLDAGVVVCLGTDSIVNLDTPDRISVVDEIRFLWNRDGTDPCTLLAMATVHGGLALGFDAEALTLSAGPLAGLILVESDPAAPDLWSGAMSRSASESAPPEVVFLDPRRL